MLVLKFDKAVVNKKNSMTWRVSVRPALEIREESRRQKIAVAMSKFDSKSDGNFLDVLPTNFSLEYMKSIYQCSYDIHFKADWT